jgi:hypothetical protein
MAQYAPKWRNPRRATKGITPQNEGVMPQNEGVTPINLHV